MASKCPATLKKLQELRFKKWDPWTISLRQLRPQDQLGILVLLLLRLLRYVHRIIQIRPFPWGPASCWSDTRTQPTHFIDCGEFWKEGWDATISSLLAGCLPVSLLTGLRQARRYSWRLFMLYLCFILWICALCLKAQLRREKNLLLFPSHQEEKINQTIISFLLWGWLGTILKSWLPSHQEASSDPSWVYEDILLSGMFIVIIAAVSSSSSLFYWYIFACYCIY